MRVLPRLSFRHVTRGHIPPQSEFRLLLFPFSDHNQTPHGGDQETVDRDDAHPGGPVDETDREVEGASQVDLTV